MRLNYGYADATGEYYIVIDTEKCDGCGECLEACPQDVFALTKDDDGRPVAEVRADVRAQLAFVCLGFDLVCSSKETNCHTACSRDAIAHSW